MNIYVRLVHRVIFDDRVSVREFCRFPLLFKLSSPVISEWSFKTCHPISSWFVHRSSDTDLLIFFVRLVFDKRVFVTTRTGRHIIRLVVAEWFNGFYNFFNCFGMYSNANIKFALFFWDELFKSASKCPTFCSAIDHLLIIWKIVNWACGNACNTILSQYFQSFSKLFKKILGRQNIDKIIHVSSGVHMYYSCFMETRSCSKMSCLDIWSTIVSNWQFPSPSPFQFNKIFSEPFFSISRPFSWSLCKKGD